MRTSCNRERGCVSKVPSAWSRTMWARFSPTTYSTSSPIGSRWMRTPLPSIQWAAVLLLHRNRVKWTRVRDVGDAITCPNFPLSASTSAAVSESLIRYTVDSHACTQRLVRNVWGQWLSTLTPFLWCFRLSLHLWVGGGNDLWSTVVVAFELPQ